MSSEKRGKIKLWSLHYIKRPLEAYRPCQCICGVTSFLDSHCQNKNSLSSDWSWMTATCVKWDGRKMLFHYCLLCVLVPQLACLASAVDFFLKYTKLFQITIQQLLCVCREWVRASWPLVGFYCCFRSNPCYGVGGLGTAPEGQGRELRTWNKTKKEAEERKRGKR